MPKPNNGNVGTGVGADGTLGTGVGAEDTLAKR